MRGEEVRGEGGWEVRGEEVRGEVRRGGRGEVRDMRR